MLSSLHHSAAMHSARNSGTASSRLGRTLLGQTVGQLMLRRGDHAVDVFSSKDCSTSLGIGTGAIGSTATGTGATNKMQKDSSPPHAKKPALVTVGAHSLASKSPTRPKANNVNTKRLSDHRHLEACYGKSNMPQSACRRSPRRHVGNLGISNDSSQNSSGSNGSGKNSTASESTQLRASQSGQSSSGSFDKMQPSGTHLVLAAALLSNLDPRRPSSRNSDREGCRRNQENFNALETQPLPATGSFHSGVFEVPRVSDEWDSTSDETEKCAEHGAGISSCDLLQQELSAINEVSANKLENDELSGLTCKLLEAEVCSVASWAEDVKQIQSSDSSDPNNPCSDMRTPVSEKSHSGSQAHGSLTHTSRRAAEQEVERLSQVIQSYESQVLPHLMVERALLNCELAKAREAAVTSFEDCQALRGRVLEVEAESSVLRTELDALRAGRHGGG